MRLLPIESILPAIAWRPPASSVDYATDDAGVQHTGISRAQDRAGDPHGKRIVRRYVSSDA
jgi:hypothetical protein